MPEPVNTEHPHIVQVPGVCGGRPVIAGTRIGVDFIAQLHQAGDQPEDIVASYPHLSLAVVHDALSYYYDHQEEIDHLLAESTLEKHAERYNFEIGEKGKVIFKDL